jgi:sulfur relay (sulfurtransferase) DsrC/TusE family protein
MPGRTQLTIGTKIEREHRATYNFLKKYVAEHRAMPKAKQLYKHIAENHLKEHPNYYTKLKRAKL